MSEARAYGSYEASELQTDAVFVGAEHRSARYCHNNTVGRIAIRPYEI